jgi:hypothetical protein
MAQERGLAAVAALDPDRAGDDAVEAGRLIIAAEDEGSGVGFDQQALADEKRQESRWMIGQPSARREQGLQIGL